MKCLPAKRPGAAGGGRGRGGSIEDLNYRTSPTRRNRFRDSWQVCVSSGGSRSWPCAAELQQAQRLTRPGCFGSAESFGRGRRGRLT